MTDITKIRAAADRYFDDAFAALNAGFRSEAARKAALADVLRSYEYGVKGLVHPRLLALPREARDEAWDALYWGIPALHVYKPKHDALLADHPDALAHAVACVELRNAIKAATITPVAPKVDPRQQEIERRVSDIIALRKEQYGRAIALGEIFGRLPVTASWHWVTNQHGTTFLRTFYFLDGRLTPLGIIVAALQALEEQAA